MSTSTIYMRNNEDVSNFLIGKFNDTRLAKIGGLLFKKMCTQLTLHIKRLAGTRALEVAFGRFLHNDKVTVNEIEKEIVTKTNEVCLGKKHVLAIQDTVEIAFPTHFTKKSEFGPTTGNKNVKGLFAHPTIIVNAENKDIIGVGGLKIWIRPEEKASPREKRKLEDKESYRWVETAKKASAAITNADMVTHVGDRESDIYELFEQVPDERNHLIVRSRHDRKLAETDEDDHSILLSQHMEKIGSVGTYEIELPEITGVRKARTATISIKFSIVEMIPPKKYLISQNKKNISVTCVEAIEVGEVPENESSIYWRLLTTHKITDIEDARQIVIWYTWRWVIEQIFRTMKKKGLNLEESQIETPEVLVKMLALSIAVAVKVLCLVHARDGKTDRLASDVFNKSELVLLALVLLKVQGKTSKQQNPYKTDTLSWATWIIARLGGWNGYDSESPPGPITFVRGLIKFENYLEGWELSQKDVCI